MAIDEIKRLDPAERWTSDIFRVSASAGAFVSVEADMSRQRDLLAALGAGGERVTYTAVFVRACALALERNPDLHVVVGATRRLHPGQVDIGLSVAGESPCAPVMVLEDAGSRTLVELAREIGERAEAVREKEQRDLAALRRWGWLLPWSTARRTVLRTGLRRPRFRRSIAGTFQVTTVPAVGTLVPLSFVATGALAAGGVTDRVVAVDGTPQVRPMATLTCPFDHKVWDAKRAATFLAEVRRIVEDEDLAPLMT
jgi:pyruvate/2-oxoglutarate dehydrogenase complex dihydrolipoamide acyltransferase (E2) component